MIVLVAWVVWAGIGLFLAVLLGVSWWFDRDARRRGAKPLSGKQMSRARWAKEREIEQEFHQGTGKGMTPKSQDAFRDAWRGKTG